MYRKNQK